MSRTTKKYKPRKSPKTDEKAKGVVYVSNNSKPIQNDKRAN